MTALAGHNGQLAALVERIERLEAEKKSIASDVKDIYAEAKANGFDTKILRKVIVQRRTPASQRAVEQELIDTYIAALGQLAGTGLGDAAIARLRGAAEGLLAE